MKIEKWKMLKEISTETPIKPSNSLELVKK